MPFNSIFDMADSWDAGRVWRQHWHKTASPLTTGSGYWMDLSMAAGTPKYNAYVGAQLEYTPMVGTSNFGINTGKGGDAYITRYTVGGGGVANTALPANMLLLDYAGFYPLVDMDNTDYQQLDNTYWTQGRWADGYRCMVVTTTPQTAASPIQVLLDYIDVDGKANTASFYVYNTPAAGCINTFSSVTGGVGNFAPFVPLGPGSKNIARLVGVTLMNSAGGFCAFVLVHPIIEAVVPDSVTPYELEFPRNGVPPFVPNGAYVNHILCPMSGGTASGITRGHIAFVRSA